MRIGIAHVQVPFIRGGADNLSFNLLSVLKAAGHEVETITMPFRFHPVSQVKRSMDIWCTENFEEMNGQRMDLVICLTFPTYYLKHSNKVTWLLHQHRSVYDLWDTPYSEGLCKTEEGQILKQKITQLDKEQLPSCTRHYTISQRVSQRLFQFNNIDSMPLYHPPRAADQFYSQPAEPFIFYPSRLESLKRQSLLINAMKYVRSPVTALISGTGGTKELLQQKIDHLDLSGRVRLLGHITQKELLAFYAFCLGVFFGPYDEDYGYVTLEAMLSSKPVITCGDSGGSLEFVIPGETGFVVDPDPEAVASKIDTLYYHQRRAANMGKSGYARYRELNISWDRVVKELVQ